MDLGRLVGRCWYCIRKAGISPKPNTPKALAHLMNPAPGPQVTDMVNSASIISLISPFSYPDLRAFFFRNRGADLAVRSLFFKTPLGLGQIGPLARF